ncbi:hypothetical protein LP52_15895 [Streptomonospora alba]|uniref:DUF4352 domain-containing protein n=1 Tax=Streptomonospora alba TaxID=183763 RepID=A0A0C2J929_9ACTN|nr:hypothetical protein [Streptomonospora alba]KIH98001.1 hypothetical protein LP52_15895 [Streptomonospora alba]
MAYPPRAIRIPLVAVVGVLLLTGCGLFGGGENGADGGGNAGGAQDPVNAGQVEPGESESRETLASQDISASGADMHIAIHELARRGETVELTLSVTRTNDSGSDPNLAFLTPPSVLDDELSTVELIDPGNAKVHTVARDGDDRCVCSSGLKGITLYPDDSALLSATFAAPPEGVETMGVRIPRAGTFNDVPLS